MWTSWNQMSAREAMIELVGGKPGYGEQPRWLKDVAKAANISIRAARDLWRGDVSDHNNWAAINLQRALVAKRTNDELKAARAEAKATAALFQQIIGGMLATDAPFFSEEITRLERVVREISPDDRS